MRFTPVVALAVLLACLPARAVELIDLQAAVPPPGDMAMYSIGHASAYSTTYPTAHPTPHPAAYSSDQLAAERREMAFVAESPALPAEPAAMPAAMVPATPVPEPVAVLMLACGLLLMVPGAWAVRWSRLGDRESLLPRRHPRCVPARAACAPPVDDAKKRPGQPARPR